MCMADFIYPERMKYYIPTLTLIYETADYWELDWSKTTKQFLESKHCTWTEAEKESVQDFVDYLTYVGQTPKDWDINWHLGQRMTDNYLNNEIQNAVKIYYDRQVVKDFFKDYVGV